MGGGWGGGRGVIVRRLVPCREGAQVLVAMGPIHSTRTYLRCVSECSYIPWRPERSPGKTCVALSPDEEGSHVRSCPHTGTKQL